MSLLHLIIFKNFFSLTLCLGLPFLLDFLLLAYPSVYFNSSQFYLIDTLAPFWNSSLFSLTHDLFFIF